MYNCKQYQGLDINYWECEHVLSKDVLLDTEKWRLS